MHSKVEGQKEKQKEIPLTQLDPLDPAPIFFSGHPLSLFYFMWTPSPTFVFFLHSTPSGSQIDNKDFLALNLEPYLGHNNVLNITQVSV